MLWLRLPHTDKRESKEKGRMMKKKKSEPKAQKRVGITGRNDLHPTFFGTSSSVNRLQLSFVTWLVGGRKLQNNCTAPAKASISTTLDANTKKKKKKAMRLQNKHAIRNLFLFLLKPGSRSPSRDGKMSESDRMERKLEKE